MHTQVSHGVAQGPWTDTIHLYTVGTESIQTPLNFSLFVSLQPFAKIKKVHFISH